MELLETQDPEKKKLIETSDRHKVELRKELHAISDKTEATLKNALIIGGTLALTYLLVSSVSSAAKSKKKKAKKAISRVDEEEEASVEEPAAQSFLSQLGENLASHATIILLDIAKEKLSEYLVNRKMKNENS